MAALDRQHFNSGQQTTKSPAPSLVGTCFAQEVGCRSLAEWAPGVMEDSEMLSSHQNCLNPAQGYFPAYFRGESLFFF